MNKEQIKKEIEKEIEKNNYPNKITIDILPPQFLGLCKFPEICPDTNEDITIINILAFEILNKMMSDKKIINLIKETVRHERQHVTQAQWLRKHQVPKSLWYFDDKIQYGTGNMEKDAQDAAKGQEWDIDARMAKYIPITRFSEKLKLFYSGVKNTIKRKDESTINMITDFILTPGWVFNKLIF